MCVSAHAEKSGRDCATRDVQLLWPYTEPGGDRGGASRMTDPETGRKRERRERGSTLVTMRRRRLCKGSESSQNKPVRPRRPSARISCMSMGDSCAMSVRSSIGTRPTFLPNTSDHTRLPFTHNIQAKTGRSRPSPQPLPTSLSQGPWENLQLWSRAGPMLKCYFEAVRRRVHPNSLFLLELVSWVGTKFVRALENDKVPQDPSAHYKEIGVSQRGSKQVHTSIHGVARSGSPQLNSDVCTLSFGTHVTISYPP